MRLGVPVEVCTGVVGQLAVWVEDSEAVEVVDGAVVEQVAGPGPKVIYN